MGMPTTAHKSRSLFDAAVVCLAWRDAVVKLNPCHQVKNPVMFVAWVGSVLATLLFLQAMAGAGEAPTWFIFSIALWLWFTVLFANFAEAMAESRGKRRLIRFGERAGNSPPRSSARSILGVSAIPCGTDRSSDEIRSAWCQRMSSSKGMCFWWKQVISSLPMARLWKVWRR